MYVYVHTIKKGKVLFRKLWTANCLRTEIWLADNRTVQKPQKKAMMLHMLVFQFIALVFWKKKKNYFRVLYYDVQVKSQSGIKVR